MPGFDAGEDTLQDLEATLRFSYNLYLWIDIAFPDLFFEYFTMFVQIFNYASDDKPLALIFIQLASFADRYILMLQ